MDLNQDGVVGLTEGQVADELTEEEQAQVDEMIQVEKDNITSKPSRAFQVARALNPEPIVSDEAMAKANELADELEEFEQKIEDELDESFKEWDEENKQESFDFKPSGTTTESFMDEVERVNEVAEADEELAEDNHHHYLKCLLVK